MLKSRIPRITAELVAKIDTVTHAVAKQIEADAQARVPVDTGKLRDAIHVERAGVAEYEVIAGDTDAFYGHIVENGGAHTAPHPFMIPAAESARPRIAGLGAAALRSL